MAFDWSCSSPRDEEKGRNESKKHGAVTHEVAGSLPDAFRARLAVLSPGSISDEEQPRGAFRAHGSARP